MFKWCSTIEKSEEINTTPEEAWQLLINNDPIFINDFRYIVNPNDIINRDDIISGTTLDDLT